MHDGYSEPSAQEQVLLVRAVAQSRNREAFAALFRFFAPRIKAFLRRAGANPALSEDLAQDALVTLWRRAESYDDRRASVATWLYTIARNLWIDQCRRADPSTLTPGQVAWLTDSLYPPEGQAEEDTMEGSVSDAAIGQALAELPAEQAEALRLSYFVGSSHSRIAATLGIPVGTVKSRIRLALAALTKQLGATS